MDSGSFRRALPWLGFAGVLVFYVVSILRLHPTNYFGLTQDDTIYFSSAQALAQGRGYILPSLPGTAPATKYPILYPWILSWVWRWNPSFPANLADALGITVVFGLAFVTLAYLFLRQLKGMGNGEALLLTAFCALHPVVLFYSASVVSEIPFSALALAAMLVGNKAMQRNGNAAAAMSCGILAGLSMLIRLFGVPVAAGILVAALVRRAWRQAAIFALCAAPLFAWLAWHTVSSAQATPPTGTSSFGPGFQQTWLYYTNYVAFLKLSSVNPHVAGSIVLSQFIYLLTHVPGFFLSSLLDRDVALLFVVTLAVLWAILAGMIRQASIGGWQPIHFALPFYVAVILSWNYPEILRFLIPFLPLFAASLWFEGKWIAGKLTAAIRSPRPLIERLSAAVLGVSITALACGMVWNLAVGDRAQLRSLSRSRAALLVEKREAYDWLRRNSSGDARAVAGEDGCLYLYTGRQAMAYIALLPAGAYEPTRLQEDLDHMTDVAQAIGAEYWLASPDDSDKQWKAAKPLLAARLDQIESVLPELFHSGGGHVRIYGLACVQHPEDPSCRSADRVLFPLGRAISNP